MTWVLSIVMEEEDMETREIETLNLSHVCPWIRQSQIDARPLI